MNYVVIKIPVPSKRALDAIGNWFFPLLLSSFVIARCIVYDPNRQLSPDEILSWYPANASFRAMLGSTADTINGAPPLYFILAWLWTAAFGKSSLALRLFSSIATAAAICLMSIVLRRAYGRLAAGAAWLVAFADPELLGNSVQIRFHTLAVAEVALAILLYQHIVAQRRPPMRLLVANACVHAAIVMTHYLGPLYSGGILAAFVLTGLARRTNPLRASLSVVAGWLAFVPWVPIFIRHSTMAKPSVWIPVPTIQNLQSYYQNLWVESAWLAKVIVGFSVAGSLLLTLVALFKRTPPVTVPSRAVRSRELPLLLLAFCILIVPLVVYFLSVRPGGTSVFLLKYFLPSVLGWSILLAHAASRAIGLCLLIPNSLSRWIVVTVLVTLLVAKALDTGAARVAEMSKRAIGTEPRPVDFPPNHLPGEPVVIEHIHVFLRTVFYSADPHRYIFAVDPEVGLAEGRGGAANHQIMSGLARQFPEHFGGVETTEDFLRTAKVFWVKRGRMHWYSMRVEHNPLFVVDQTDSQGDMVHVRRIY